jgi:hypothetical protein
MTFMIFILLVLLTAIGAAVWLTSDSRRRLPIQAFAIGPAGLAGLNLVALWAGRKQFRIAVT